MRISPRKSFNLRFVLFAIILSFLGLRTAPVGAYTVDEKGIRVG